MEYLYSRLTTFTGHQVVYRGNGNRIVLFQLDEYRETRRMQGTSQKLQLSNIC